MSLIPVDRGYSHEFIGQIQLLVSVFFFGFLYVAMRHAMENGASPYLFVTCLFMGGTVVLFVMRLYLNYYNAMKAEELPPSLKIAMSKTEDRASVLYWSTLMGIPGFLYVFLIQLGLVTLSVGKSGFILGMCVIIFPFFVWILSGFAHQTSPVTWIALTLSLCGLYLVSGCSESDSCFSGSVGISMLYAILSMFFLALWYIAAEQGSKVVDGVTLTLSSFGVASVCSLIALVVFDLDAVFHPIAAVGHSPLTLAIICWFAPMGFLLNVLGLEYVPATHAVVITLLTSVTSALLAYACLDEVMNYIEILGCMLMFISAHLTTVWNWINFDPDEDMEHLQDEFMQINDSDDEGDDLEMEFGQKRPLMSGSGR